MFICISMLNMLKISGLEMYYCRLNRHYNMSLVNKIIKNDSNEKILIITTDNTDLKTH